MCIRDSLLVVNDAAHVHVDHVPVCGGKYVSDLLNERGHTVRHIRGQKMCIRDSPELGALCKGAASESAPNPVQETERFLLSWFSTSQN